MVAVTNFTPTSFSLSYISNGYQNFRSALIYKSVNFQPLIMVSRGNLMVSRGNLIESIGNI